MLLSVGHDHILFSAAHNIRGEQGTCQVIMSSETKSASGAKQAQASPLMMVSEKTNPEDIYVQTNPYRRKPTVSNIEQRWEAVA